MRAVPASIRSGTGGLRPPGPRRRSRRFEDKNRSMELLKTAILHRYNQDAFERVIYSESHDEVANGKSRVCQARSTQPTPKGLVCAKTLNTRLRPSVHLARHPDALPGAGISAGRLVRRHGCGIDWNEEHDLAVHCSDCIATSSACAMQSPRRNTRPHRPAHRIPSICSTTTTK